MSNSGQRIPHPASTRFLEDLTTPIAKRLKRGENERSPLRSRASSIDDSPASASSERAVRTKDEVPDSEEEIGDDSDDDHGRVFSKTDLECVLPSVRTDKEAIQEYEATRAAEDAEGDDLHTRLDNRNWVRGRNSIYVDAFNLALHTVLEEERHLFDDAEQEVFSQWRSLSYSAQYLYVRLFLRKTAAWHRVSKLRYHGDIGDLDAAVAELQRARELPVRTTETIVKHPGELEPPGNTVFTEPSFTFADASGEHITTMEEASSLLTLDELKSLAKDVKVQGKTKKELLISIRRTSHTQTGLGWKGLKRSDTEESVKSEVSTPAENEEFGANRDTHFVRKILANTTGECIRLTDTPHKLFERVHLVFYRSTEWTEKSLTTIILARISRRNFPEYIIARSADIFESRAMLLEFEAALRTQFKIDNILEFNGKVTEEGYDTIQNIADEVYPRWKTLITHEYLKEERVYDSGEGAYLRRFSPAWVYTRIMHKSLLILARRHEHEREHGLLVELLDQTLFHASRRGSWYQRKALLEEHHLWKLRDSEGRSEDSQRRYWRNIALQTCEQGLQDPDCHLIYHYDLQKRLMKLERAMRVPKREQHEFGHALLAQAVERTIHGIRLQKETSSNGKKTPPPASTTIARGSLTRERSFGGPTLWLDEDDSGGAVSVEEFALTHYRTSGGWKGLHTEGGVMRTLFGLLFYDILFAYVPGVFQTAFQAAPLDLRTDAFFSARRQALEHRFAALSNGEASALIDAMWAAHAERQTCIVGVRWDYPRANLLELAGAFPGAALAAICRVLAQEYAERGGGMPDLFLWKASSVDDATKDGGVMFVEVKSENDRLSDTQRLWIDVITAAGVPVEVCHVLASEVRIIEAK